MWRSPSGKRLERMISIEAYKQNHRYLPSSKMLPSLPQSQRPQLQKDGKAPISSRLDLGWLRPERQGSPREAQGLEGDLRAFTFKTKNCHQSRAVLWCGKHATGLRQRIQS